MCQGFFFEKTKYHGLLSAKKEDGILFISRLWSIFIIDMDLLHIQIYLEIFVFLGPSEDIHF